MSMKIGVDLGGTNVRVALVDEKGIVDIIKEPCKADKPANEVLDHLRDMIRKMITSEVKGIGLGVPSAVDTERGIVYNVVNIPSWKEVHIKEEFEKEFNLPVFVNNDANCFALGEKYYGAGKGFDNILGVTLGTGVGAGVIINSDLYQGNNTCAGEIGCLPYLDSNYELYCSSGFFEKYHNTTGVEAFNAAINGNNAALKIWDEFGGHVGNLVSMILYTYDPQAIVFGGSISSAYKLFSPSMYKQLGNFLFPKAIEKLKIAVSEIKEVGILGAASLVRS
jgi:glucokinase